MNIRKSLFVVVLLLVSVRLSYSWNEDVTHRDLSGIAADHSILGTPVNYLKTIGYPNGLEARLQLNGKMWKVKEWLQEGARLEDSSGPLYVGYIDGKGRSFNHFHNPLKPWAQAGLNDFFAGESSLLWAQDGNNQENFYEGNWSWGKTREYYYSALTGRDFSGYLVAPDLTGKKEYLARTFMGLGHQMHLLQDTAVPDHVRNDAHPEDALFGRNRRTGSAYFEAWAKNNAPTVGSFAANPVFPNIPLNVSFGGLVPITQLYDTDQYDGLNASAGINQGLAEYTNANFFSDDTMFAAESYSVNDRHYFPFPKKTSTDLQSLIDQNKVPEIVIAEDGILDASLWIKKERDGEAVDHFVKPGYFTKLINPFEGLTLYSRTFYRDERCHGDYARLLIPRAVGYSAGLLNYFFRGSIDISVPTNGLYSMIDATQAGFDPVTAAFTSLKLKATNTTSTGENMTNGTIQLVVKYKEAQSDPFQSGPVPTSTDFSYIVVPEKNNVSVLYSASPTELNFDLSQNPIPLRATDVYLQVVFKGTLGNEENAVAVGFKDISEPTPIDIFNNMDKICIDGDWHDAGTPETIAEVDANHDGVAGTDEADVYAYDLQDIYLRFSPYSQDPPYFFASPSTYDIHVPYLSAGAPVRAVYLLSDYMFNKGQYLTWVNTDNNDPWYHPDVNWLWWFSAVKRQVDYSEDSALCGGSPPCEVDVYPIAIPTFSNDNLLGFHTFRNTSMWWGSAEIWINTPVPSTSSCSYDSL